MHFIRIIQAATKSTTRTKKLTKKPSKKLPKTAPKKDLSKNKGKDIKPSKSAPKSQNKAINKRFKIKPTSEWPHQDESLPTFEDLLEQGYNRATFVAHPNACNFCKRLNGKTWNLSRFVQGLNHSAPIFEHTHVNSFSKIKVWDVNDELEPVYVDYTGEIEY